MGREKRSYEVGTHVRMFIYDGFPLPQLSNRQDNGRRAAITISAHCLRAIGQPTFN